MSGIQHLSIGTLFVLFDNDSLFHEAGGRTWFIAFLVKMSSTLSFTISSLKPIRVI